MLVWQRLGWNACGNVELLNQENTTIVAATGPVGRLAQSFYQ
jgi:hypothetical protein